MNAESYRSKLQMIVECEHFLMKKQREDKTWFPDFIILCRPIDSEQTINGLKDEQWLGFINSVNKNTNTNFQRVMNEMHKETSRNEKAQVLHHQKNESIEKKIKDIEGSISKLKSEVSSKFNTIDTIASMMSNVERMLKQQQSPRE